MNWTIDPHHEQYKVYRLRLAADKVRKGITRINNIDIKIYQDLFIINNISKNLASDLYGPGQT